MLIMRHGGMTREHEEQCNEPRLSNIFPHRDFIVDFDHINVVCALLYVIDVYMKVLYVYRSGLLVETALRVSL